MTLYERPCINCGKTLKADQPISHGDWIGFISKPHECGPDFDLLVMEKNTEQGREDMRNLFTGLKKAIKS